MSDIDTRWHSAPAAAYLAWQENQALGSSQQQFSARSIIQHCAMFDRFYRFLVLRGTTLAHFSEADLMAFLDSISSQSKPAATTRQRYAKLVDRLCRHLTAQGIRSTNPGQSWALWQAWPSDDPTLLYLDEAADARLQAYLQRPVPLDEPRALRDRAALALLLGSGITAAELRHARIHALELKPPASFVVAARGMRAARQVALAAFAVPALEAWLSSLGQPDPHALLFTASGNKPLSDWTLIHKVKEALQAIEFAGAEMGPRILRNTYARRALLAGVSNQAVSEQLGLVSLRTVHRIQQTLKT